MNIEKLIQDAILTGAPVLRKCGSKAILVADVRTVALLLGDTVVEGNISEFPILGFTKETGEKSRMLTWNPRGERTCFGDTIPDIVGPWLEFDRWEALVPEIRYIAMSDNGEWHGFTEEPVEFNGAWVTDPACFVLDALAGLPKLDLTLWQYSLLKRPQGVYHGR